MHDLQVDDAGEVRQAALDLDRLTFHVKPVPPFRLDLTVWALRRRADNAIDRWDGRTYRRILSADGRPLSVEVTQTAPVDRPMLRVTASGSGLPSCTRFAVMSALTRLLGVDRCLDDFYRAADGDPVLGPLARDFRGLKPPRFPTLFETLVNAFACQQVTLTLGVRLLGRLAEGCGRGWDGPDGPAHAFPAPDELAACSLDRLRTFGLSRQKAQAIVELAGAVAGGRLDLDALQDLDDTTSVARLRTLRGVGRWTAEYVLLRGLGRLHVFPGDDVGARNNLHRWLGLLEPLDYEGVGRAVAQWAPFQGLVYLHLLLDALRREPDRRRLARRMRSPGRRTRV